MAFDVTFSFINQNHKRTFLNSLQILELFRIDKRSNRLFSNFEYKKLLWYLYHFRIKRFFYSNIYRSIL